jgi:hypothetical protein
MVIPAPTEENAAEAVAPAEIERPVQLNDFVPGLRFREVMTGMITKGRTDPGGGVRRSGGGCNDAARHGDH